MSNNMTIYDEVKYLLKCLIINWHGNYLPAHVMCLLLLLLQLVSVVFVGLMLLPSRERIPTHFNQLTL